MSPHADAGELLKLAEKLDKRLGKDRHGQTNPDMGLSIGPGLYEEIAEARDFIRQAASRGSAGGERPMAYWVEHPKFGMELSLDQPSEDAVRRGWVGTPLYAHPDAQASVVRGAWTQDQFWEYVEGLTDPLVRDQIRDMLDSQGLSLSSASRGTEV